VKIRSYKQGTGIFGRKKHLSKVLSIWHGMEERMVSRERPMAYTRPQGSPPYITL
jgi:hypothetical protein